MRALARQTGRQVLASRPVTLLASPPACKPVRHCLLAWVARTIGHDEELHPGKEETVSRCIGEGAVCGSSPDFAKLIRRRNKSFVVRLSVEVAHV